MGMEMKLGVQSEEKHENVDENPPLVIQPSHIWLVIYVPKYGYTDRQAHMAYR